MIEVGRPRVSVPLLIGVLVPLAAAAIILIVGALWPAGVAWYQGPIAAAGEAMRGAPGTIVEWNANWPSFSVYRRAATPPREPRPGEIVLTRADRERELPAHEVVFARREVLLARITGVGP